MAFIESASVKHPMQWRDAHRALKALRNDRNDTAQAFKIVMALRGNSLQRNLARMRSSARGREILSERRNLGELLRNKTRLHRLPPDSLGRQYLDFMEHGGFTVEGLVTASKKGYGERTDDSDVRVFSNWARDSHDLWHVLTGYGRDSLGELCLLGVTYSQTHNIGTAFIALMGLKNARVDYPGAPVVRAVLQGFRVGRNARWLITQDWDDLLERPIEAVRRELRLERATYYERSLPMRDTSLPRNRNPMRRPQG